jgi:hypothetical protein
MSDSTSPDPIRHLIDAVVSLGLATRDLHGLNTTDSRKAALRQDCAEYADEAGDLLRDLRGQLDANPDAGGTA